MSGHTHTVFLFVEELIIKIKAILLNFNYYFVESLILYVKSLLSLFRLEILIVANYRISLSHEWERAGVRVESA